MSGLILYSQEDCHLCDDSEGLLHAAGLAESYQKMDIETDPELLKQYGIHIPVLKRADNQQELFWPFDLAELETFLRAGE